MKNRYFVTLGAVLLCGCSASQVIKPGTTPTSEYAPENERARNGIVKYVSAGSDSVIKARRENAYKIMYESCGGKYKIVNESLKSEGGMISAYGSSAFYSDTQYVYIEYQCI